MHHLRLPQLFYYITTGRMPLQQPLQRQVQLPPLRAGHRCGRACLRAQPGADVVLLAARRRQQAEVRPRYDAVPY